MENNKLKKSRNNWIIGGLIFLIIAAMRFLNSVLGGCINLVVSILFFINAYKFNRQIKK